MLTRERLHILVDAIPEDDLETVQQMLEQHATDPLLLALANAPEDDEPLTSEEDAAIREGEAAAERGEVESWEAVRNELLHRGRSS